MKCIKDDQIVLKGNYNTDVTQNLVIVLEMCDSTKGQKCKSKEEIKDWMKFKYIVTHTNTRSFIQYEFFEKSIDSTSHVEWYPISEVVRSETVKMITRTRLKLNDHHWNIGNLR